MPSRGARAVPTEQARGDHVVTHLLAHSHSLLLVASGTRVIGGRVAVFSIAVFVCTMHAAEASLGDLYPSPQLPAHTPGM